MYYMKKLFETFRKSIYGPEFYHLVAEAPFKDALRHYFKFTGLLAILMTIAFSVLLVPQGVRFVKEEAPALIKKYYPAELVITINNGEASTNVTEPYVIPATDGAKDALTGSTMKNLFVVDTKNEFNKKTFENYKTFALLTKGEIVTQSRKGQISIQDLRGAPNVVVSEDVLLAWVEKVRLSLGAFVPAGIALIFVIIAVGFAFYMAPLLLFALIPFFLAWIKKIPLTYGGAYKISLYAVLPGLVLKALLNISGFFFVPSYLSLFVFMLVIFLNMREKEQPSLFKQE